MKLSLSSTFACTQNTLSTTPLPREKVDVWVQTLLLDLCEFPQTIGKLKSIDRASSRRFFETDVSRLSISVDYDLPLQYMLSAGHYDFINEGIAEWRFPNSENGFVQYEAKLFHFDRGVTSPEAMHLIRSDNDSHPWEPANAYHLAAFGATYPELQRTLWIAAPDPLCDHTSICYIPVLFRIKEKRIMGLWPFVNVWTSYYRFLAVRKVPCRNAL